MSGGAHGHAPSWYRLIRAARYLGVAPWDLYERPSYWCELALQSERAEAKAEHAAAERARRKG